MIKILKDLAQLAIDAAFAYKQVLEKINQIEIYNNMNIFQIDHLQHIENLNVMIVNLGATPLASSQDLKGYLIEGFTALRRMRGIAGAQIAITENKKLTNRKYREAIDKIPICLNLF